MGVPDVLGFTETVTPRMPLRRIASRAAALATHRRVRAASQLLLLGGLVFVLLRLHTIWHDSRLSIGDVDWPLLVAATLVSACALTATALVWLAILRRLGAETEPWFIAIFFQAQLSKYIPGSLWQYVGRVTLAQSHGLPIRAVAVSLPIELIALMPAGAALSLLLLGWWGAAGAILVLLALSLCARLSVERRLTTTLRRVAQGRDVRGAVPAAIRASRAYAGILLIIGFGFWLTARALYGVPVDDVLTYVGAFVAAWLGGLIAVYAPGGVGVREAILVALLRGRLGSADALVLAAASRAILTLVDVGAAVTGVAIVRARARDESRRAAIVRDVDSSSSL
jgi:uncharacterized membrane protein YbhN (UPF0104 family)